MANAFTNQTAHGTLTITDSRGNPATVDGVPVWATSDATVLTVTPAADGMSFDVNTVAPGTARLTVTADADLGSGVSTITGMSEDVVVTQNPNSLASTFNISFGPFTDV